MPVAYAVARALGAQLDVIVVRKLGVPFQPELGMGAIAEGGGRVVNEPVVRQARVGPQEFAAVDAREHAELERRARRIRGNRPRVPLAGRTVVVVDDGLATGSTAVAACRALRAEGATRIVLAVPVAAQDTVARLRREADEVVCLETPKRFLAVGAHYADFSQTSDEQVSALLEDAAGPALSDSHAYGPEAGMEAGPVRLS